MTPFWLCLLYRFIIIHNRDQKYILLYHGQYCPKNSTENPRETPNNSYKLRKYCILSGFPQFVHIPFYPIFAVQNLIRANYANYSEHP
jgi:hypothetical protein